ncbi:MAG: 16S rRNA (cytosine(967)-C(5))-methyltransferase RsmB [Nitrospirae bacterium]|nr:16S rRNA (cytosine(967)-C(5))-methyltransferase RsmB [Nitrospirota bacterium]
MSPARERAVVALNKIFKRGKKPKEVLEALSWEDDKRERAFLMELVYGVLRHRDSLDWLLKDFLKKPDGLSFDTINNLRLAAYQIEYMRVPEWAVVNEAVDVEKAQKGKASLVNAVLRNFLRRRETALSAASTSQNVSRFSADPAQAIATATSHPLWLVKRWIKRFGQEGALGLAHMNNELPAMTIRVDDSVMRENTLSVLSAKGVQARKTEYSPSGVVVEGLHSFSDLYDVLESPCVVQDEAAQLITWLLDPRSGEMVLDACAAPGGKTTHIAKMVGESGKVIAVEADVQRISRLEENIARLGLNNVSVVHGDIRAVESGIIGALSGKGLPAFDRILIDAPCSALGVIRRNPDVKYRHQPRDLQRFRDNQIALVQSVAKYLKVGGSMVYAVCSTEPEEGEEVIGTFLHSNQNFSIIRGEYDFLRSFEIIDSGRVFYRTYPHKHKMDGFFAARLKRIG